jgi:hypothetical protein
MSAAMSSLSDHVLALEAEAGIASVTEQVRFDQCFDQSLPCGSSSEHVADQARFDQCFDQSLPCGSSSEHVADQARFDQCFSTKQSLRAVHVRGLVCLLMMLGSK